MRRPALCLTALTLASLACAAGSGTRGDPARDLVAAALERHGDAARLAALGVVEFRLTGERVMIDQSRRGDPPWDREPSEVWFIRDAVRDRWFWQTTSSYPGLGPFGSRRVLSRERQFELDPTRSSHGPELMRLSADDTLGTRQDLSRFVPGLLLELARESGDGPRLVERRPGGSGEVAVVAFRDHRDRTIELLLDPATHELLGYVHRRPDAVYGVAVDSVAYHGYRDIGGLRVPGRLEEHLNGQLARELTYQVRVGAVAESLFTVPAGYHEAAPGMSAHEGHNMGAPAGGSLQRIGRGIHLDERSNAMVVEFSDHVAVFDCPNDFATSQATIDAIRDRLGGKAVRYLVASHTHPDHCGGARAYFLAGATVIAARDHAGFYRRLAEARHELAPDGYSSAGRPPLIEPIPPGGQRILADGSQRVRLLNIGPSPHSEETIIALVSGEELLWQVDLFLAQMTGPVVANRPVTDWLAQELERRGLTFRKIIDTHIGTVFTREEFNEALRRGGRRGLGE